MMKQNPRMRSNLFEKFPAIIWLAALLLVAGCAPAVAGGLVEFEGIVVGKRGTNQILVVPNITAADLTGQNKEELLALAIDQGGVYFSVDQASFAAARIGSQVIVSYDPDEGEEPTMPPRRNARSVEFVDD